MISMLKSTIIIAGFSSAALLTTDADARTLCFDQKLSEATQLKIEPLGGQDYFRPDEYRLLQPKEGVTLSDLSPLLNRLEDAWQTPASGWPVQAVKIEFVDNYTIKCRIIYANKTLFAQYDDLSGFVVQGIKERYFEALNDTLLQEAGVDAFTPPSLDTSQSSDTP